MDLDELIRGRRSVRSFRDEPVEEATLRQILDAADRAPTAGNLQAFEVVVVQEEARRADLARAALKQRFVARAPLDLVFLAHPARSGKVYSRRGEVLYCIQDATIACAFAYLRAVDLGLGGTWVGAFDDDAVRRVVGAPRDLLPVAILPLGYPAKTPRPTPRRGASDIAWRESYGTR